jgi:hypothetical protein
MSEIINDVIRKAILDYENELGSNNSSESA